MRTLLLLLAIALAALYFTVGLRFGVLTLTQTALFNASGTNTYTYRTLEDQQQVGVTGTCKVNSGSVTLRLYDPVGNQVGNGQVCQRGAQNEWTLNLVGGGKAGLYRVEVDFAKFSGTISLKEYHAGG